MLYQIEMPEKGSGLIEYIVKYITIFIVVLIGLWSLLIMLFVQFSVVGLTAKIYTWSFVVSLILTVGLMLYLIQKLRQKIKQGILYKIEFVDDKNRLKLFLFNDYKNSFFEKEIPYTQLMLKEKQQNIEIKSELKFSIYNRNKLINSINIAKTPWTAHPKIVNIIDKLRLVANNK